VFAVAQDQQPGCRHRFRQDLAAQGGSGQQRSSWGDAQDRREAPSLQPPARG